MSINFRTRNDPRSDVTAEVRITSTGVLELYLDDILVLYGKNSDGVFYTVELRWEHRDHLHRMGFKIENNRLVIK